MDDKRKIYMFKYRNNRILDILQCTLAQSYYICAPTSCSMFFIIDFFAITFRLMQKYSVNLLVRDSVTFFYYNI